MEAIDFEQSNITMGAGDNPNTHPVRASACKNMQMPYYKGTFIVTKWEMSGEEKYKFKQKIKEVLEDDILTLSKGQIAERIISKMPKVFLSCMGMMVPVMVFQDDPEAIFRPQFMVPDKDFEARVNAINNKPRDN